MHVAHHHHHPVKNRGNNGPSALGGTIGCRKGLPHWFLDPVFAENSDNTVPQIMADA